MEVLKSEEVIKNDENEVTQQEFDNFLKVNSRDNEGWGMKEFIDGCKRKEQIIEAIKNEYDLCDFDRWQDLQDVLFKKKDYTLDWETSQVIINLLYEKDIEILDLV